MAKYIKKEYADLNETGRTQAYYKMQVNGNLGTDLFIDFTVKHRRGLDASVLKAALMQLTEEMSFQIANGYSVTLDGLGTFGAKLGVRSDMEQDSFEEGETHRNAKTIHVTGVSYRADKDLIKQIDRKCVLERAGESRLRKLETTLEERAEIARGIIAQWGSMRVWQYAQATGLSHSSASIELRQLAQQENSGIMRSGRGPSLIYVARPAKTNE